MAGAENTNQSDNLESAINEVLFILGKAILYAQFVEHAILGCVLSIKDTKVKFTAEDFLSESSDKRSPMLGQLIQALRPVCKLEPGLQSRLDNFVKTRNHIVHHFFINNSQTEVSIETVKAQRKTLEDFLLECSSLHRMFLGFLNLFPRTAENENTLNQTIEKYYLGAEKEGRKIFQGLVAARENKNDQ